ncbi:Lipid transfer protein/Par allergen [Parasponia andersonii]|uniref:Non-specific lipid-transfer protein n=1 Tax=Parasponia andersonii TaxID=3476 RepID=A0A2P5BS19_PARAD|nr:Lipid transfer protein/Par allergen [Parasponia andersonii]
MASSWLFKLASRSLMVITCTELAASKSAEATITCGQVVRYLTPCISYVANGGTVPAACCNGIRTLYGLAQTIADRQGVCKCVKDAISGFSCNGYNVNFAAWLPSKCGVNLPYKISPSTNCQRYRHP